MMIVFTFTTSIPFQKCIGICEANHDIGEGTTIVLKCSMK